MNLFLDRILCYQSEYLDFLSLADTMGSIFGLLITLGIERRIKYDDFVSTFTRVSLRLERINIPWGQLTSKVDTCTSSAC